MLVGEGGWRWLWSRNFGEAEGVERAAGFRRSVKVRKVVARSPLEF